MENDAELYPKLISWARRLGNPTALIRINRLPGTEEKTLRVESNYGNEGKNGYTTCKFTLFFVDGIPAQMVITISS